MSAVSYSLDAMTGIMPDHRCHLVPAVYRACGSGMGFIRGELQAL
ncbi:hypothetical protein [Acidicapsa ligni]|nr:hypothetical protein [Acidicapsa ligni]